MKLTYLLLLCLAVTAVFAKGKNNKRDRSRGDRAEEVMLNAREGGIEMDDDDEYETVDIQKQPVDVVVGQYEHPCREKKCKRGEVCVLEDKTAICVCQTCSPREDGEADIKACSTHNVTYGSECELDRDHCLCKESQPGCTQPRARKVKIDYYGACKELTKCPEVEFNQFGARMRDWLFRIMRELANRSELDEYLDMVESATNDDMHADAVMWKFCDLDVDPEDRKVTRRELMFIIASIKPMERCLVPFLSHCDTDDDNTISLVEWGTCLDIDHQAITDKCHHVKQMRG